MKFGDQRGESENWIGKRVRDCNERYGAVIEDWCNLDRVLTIQFDDGEQYDLILDNVNESPEDKLKIQWEYWSERYPDEWAYVSDYWRNRETNA